MLTEKPKILIYSHDSFGLGHLRRCRAIAHSLVGQISELSVLILSGSPIIGSFDFRARVDFVRIPGVIKLRNGEYTSLNLHIDIEHTLAIRSSIIEHTAQVYNPDIFIVDKEPTGLRGEVLPTLETLKAAGTRLVLGLRDVMDDPDTLREEWERKNVTPALVDLYDEIWIYGQPNIHDPLAGIGMPQAVHDKTLYTGYLRRDLPRAQRPMEHFGFSEDPFILVTPGGGGDGEEIVDWVLRAYEAHRASLLPALIVLGPFMAPEAQAQFMTRAETLDDIHIIDFTPQIEPYLDRATAVVAMGGYNTFCEILSFDKPTLLVPRIEPRREQAIRASRAQANGLANVLPIDSYPNIDLMTEALVALPSASPPSAASLNGLLDGLTAINLRVRQILCAEDDEEEEKSALG
ncbi:putative glycosyltransferase [Breoghania corrubedonensis]|uniref:Putative glycosyltransferase n=1 Tax=Breoghania corrubedonensis TaxID=665038 RepID=A0A2T5V1H0_9HYPH|nr:glycosyltransferase [Breoghania corrubedonensis]PTW57605.1 putative glycosyltransferase [Breoghania corrubedonensis]